MTGNYKGEGRNDEITSFYYLIFEHRIRQGIGSGEAREKACDAVTLRYGISKGRLLNIISSQKSSRNTNMAALRENARALIAELALANKGLDETRERNERLISLLNECIK